MSCRWLNTLSQHPQVCFSILKVRKPHQNVSCYWLFHNCLYEGTAMPVDIEPPFLWEVFLLLFLWELFFLVFLIARLFSSFSILRMLWCSMSKITLINLLFSFAFRVDPWIAQVWTAWVHLYVNFFSINTVKYFLETYDNLKRTCRPTA